MSSVARWLGPFVIWSFVGSCAVFVFFPELVPMSFNADSGHGLTSLVHINGTRGTPNYDCYTYPWAANVYATLRIAILVGVVPFVSALIFRHRAKQ